MTNQAAQKMPETLKAIADNIDRLAFSLPAPNSVTPELVGQAIHLRTFAAALSQAAGVVSDEMVERACKKYAFREDGALWPDAYSEHEVTAERTLMREFLEHVLAAAPAASGGEDKRDDGLVTPYPVAPMGHGVITIGEGHVNGVRALIFGNRGSGVFGEEAEGNRGMADGETICAITFATPESVDLLRNYLEFIAANFDIPDARAQPRPPMQVQPQPPAGASVSGRAREYLAAEYRTHGWHEDAGRLCMGGDPTSFVEDDALRVIDRLIEQGDEDDHVITELGRLLAAIAVILKGPEPAGTAWSYHDLPELVASALSEPRQVAAEMKAWAHTKMAEQQSSRRDRMMVSEWAKRLLPESSFPVKDFDVEGMSITKEAAREAVKRVALEQALTQQRGPSVADDMRAFGVGYMLDGQRVDPSRITIITTPQPSADAVRELVQRWRERAKRKRVMGLANEALLDEAHADELESLLGRGGK